MNTSITRPRTLWLGIGSGIVFAALLATGGTTLRHNALDQHVAATVHEAGSNADWLRAAAATATTLGSTGVLIAMVVLGSVILIIQRRWLAAAQLILTAAASSALVSIIKAVVARPRPALADPFATAGGFSFPSGHATNSTVVYLMSLLLLIPAGARLFVAVVSGALIGAIAISRVLLGVHWLTDVVAGIALGVTIVVGSERCASVLRRARRPAAMANRDS